MPEASAPTPFDLDAVARERRRDAFTFTYRGKQFEFPAQIDIRPLAELRRGHYAEALEMLLGPKQWADLDAMDAVFTAPMFDALIDAYMAHQGVTKGESSASTDS